MTSTPARRSPTRLSILPLLATLVTACSGGGSGPADSAAPEAGADASTGSDAAPTPDAARDDASVPDAQPGSDAGPEAGIAPDASHPTSPTRMLLVAVTATPGTAAYGAAYRDGAWGAVTPIAQSTSLAHGGGVTVLPDGRGLAVVSMSSGNLAGTSVWSDGTWSAAAPIDNTPSAIASPPAVTSGGVLVARVPGSGPAGDRVNAFDPAGSTWGAAETAGTTSTFPDALPVLIASATNDPVLITYDGSSDFVWSQRAGGTWSAAQSGPFPILNPEGTVHIVGIAAAARAGTGEIVAAFLTGSDLASAEVQTSTFDAGAWGSSARTSATPVARYGLMPLSMAALPDGRLALAVVTSGGGIGVTISNDGGSWSYPQSVGAASVPTDRGAPVAVAAGVGDAVLEVAYVDAATHALMHTRLTDEANNTWSAPATLDATQTWKSVWVAAGP